MIETPRLRRRPGRCGPWEVRERLIREGEWGDIYTGEPIPAGVYTLLLRHDEGKPERVVMADWPSEWLQLAPLATAYHQAPGGTVLIGGLGLGMAVELLLLHPVPPRRIQVIERSRDVVALVGEQLLHRHRGAPLELYMGDVHDADPAAAARGRPWDFVWMDLWDTPTANAAREMTVLQDRWGPHTRWMGCWCEDVAQEFEAHGELLVRAPSGAHGPPRR